MDIRQGDIFWAPLMEPGNPEPGDLHPHVVIQDDVLNRSREAVINAEMDILKSDGSPDGTVPAS